MYTIQFIVYITDTCATCLKLIASPQQSGKLVLSTTAQTPQRIAAYHNHFHLPSESEAAASAPSTGEDPTSDMSDDGPCSCTENQVCLRVGRFGVHQCVDCK